MTKQAFPINERIIKLILNMPPKNIGKLSGDSKIGRCLSSTE